MGSQFSLIIGGLVGIIYSVMGGKYCGDVKNDFEYTGKHRNYVLHEKYEGDTDKPRKIIPGKSPFILFRLSKDKNVTVVSDPVYFNVGRKGGWSVPIGGGSHTEVENKTICRGWCGIHGIHDILDGVYRSFDDEEYTQQLFLNTTQAVTDFCHDVDLSMTQYQLKPTVRADFVTANMVHVLSGQGSHYIGINRKKLIASASEMIAVKSYPLYRGIGMLGVYAVCFGLVIRYQSE